MHMPGRWGVTPQSAEDGGSIVGSDLAFDPRGTADRQIESSSDRIKSNPNIRFD